jgi:hypothetical protein
MVDEVSDWGRHCRVLSPERARLGGAQTLARTFMDYGGPQHRESSAVNWPRHGPAPNATAGN